MEFLFVFFPITFGIYFLLPEKARNYWLLLASLFFYAWGEPKFLFVMLFSIFFNYLMALHIAELRPDSVERKLILIITTCVNLGILFIFKYMNFVTSEIHAWFPQTLKILPQTDFLLPIGISFFTFQAQSYVVDVYRGIQPQKNLGFLGLYISLFPQLIAGPIVRYTTIADQIKERKVTRALFSKGMLRFLYGFNKKMLLSNLVAEVADIAFGTIELSVCMAWLGAICYTLQIYFDFSGYSEMAIGLGQMFGFQFLENFNYPYMAKTVTEFWRRWHISLGTWFRDYVYFPLGGSRVKSKLRLVFNLFVVWLATGLWHGASWNFILWGVMYGTILTLEKLLAIPDKVQDHRITVVVYQIFTLLTVVLGWVLFRAEDIASAIKYLKTMFGWTHTVLIDTTFHFYLREYFTVIAMGIFCSTPIFREIKIRLSINRTWSVFSIDTMEYLVQFVLFLISISFLVMNAHNPFIYFNF